MENLVGRKIRGFRFGTKKGSVFYHPYMDKHVDEVGEIIKQTDEHLVAQFKKGYYYSYPLPEALNHLVEEPIIPELGEGVEMEVSYNGIDWTKRVVLGTHKRLYITNAGSYLHARPIPVKKLTMEELESIVGFKFEIVNKIEI